MNILSSNDSKRAYRDYLFYNKQEICECEEKITLSNVVAVEVEKTVCGRDVEALEYFCSVHCAEEEFETVKE